MGRPRNKAKRVKLKIAVKYCHYKLQNVIGSLKFLIIIQLKNLLKVSPSRYGVWERDIWTVSLPDSLRVRQLGHVFTCRLQHLQLEDPLLGQLYRAKRRHTKQRLKLGVRSCLCHAL